MNFVEELRWRGLIHDMMPGTEEELAKGMASGYIGFDPTADSLHVCSLLQIITLMRFQKAGHKPFALVGGATGMVGDPTGKSEERNLLSEDVVSPATNSSNELIFPTEEACKEPASGNSVNEPGKT